MDVELVGPEQVPVPPEKVRVLSARAAAYSDGRRVKVSVRLTPFLERPDVELRIVDGAGQLLAEAAVIECVETDFELTLHLRQGTPRPAACELAVRVRYPDRDLQTDHTLRFSIPPDLPS
ncbi:MAG: hypothetical protein MUO23_01605 [Anaerolineales bacterium]|nr:hypothetical protein [Anaerolineales bacterium]